MPVLNDFRLLIARRYLLGRRQISLISYITAISMTGVVLGVAALIVVLSVMNGFYEVVRDRLVSIDPHVRITSVGAEGLTPSDSLLTELQVQPHVTDVGAYVEGKALLTYEEGDLNKVVIVRGIDSSALTGVTETMRQAGFGSFELDRRADRPPGIVVGMGLSQRFGLLPAGSDVPASRVGLLSAQAIERSFSRLFGPPPLQPFLVTGIYDLEAIYDESRVFVDLQAAQQLFNTGNRITGVELRLDDLEHAEEVKSELQEELPASRYTVQTWYDIKESLYQIMRAEKWVASLILILIVIVAAFNVVGSLTMIVIEKRRDVGVLQAMGVSRRDIRRIFLMEGLLVGGVGTCIGLALGLGLALLQKYYALVPLAGGESFIVQSYPISIQALDLAIIVLVSLGLCLLASIYPASRAAAVAPAEAVQMEG